MGIIGEIQAPPDPDPWFECNWDDPCHVLVHEDEENAPLCKEHSDEMYREEAADNKRKQQKEDEIPWT